MTLNDFLNQVREFLDSRLFGIGDTNVTIASVLTVLIIVIATIWGARIARRASRRVLLGRGITDEGTVGSISSLVNYVVLFVGFAIAIRTIGIDLDALFAAGAIFAIALGFALQGIVQNFCRRRYSAHRAQCPASRRAGDRGPDSSRSRVGTTLHNRANERWRRSDCSEFGSDPGHGEELYAA